MDIITLKTRARTGTGKSYTRKARAQGWIPAVYYGHGDQTRSIEVDYNDFNVAVRNRKQTHIFDLGIEGVADSKTVIKEIQYNVVKNDEFYHIDFQHINMAEKVHVTRKLVLSGVCMGVKAGGELENNLHKLRLECLPADIPEVVTVDITNLDINGVIHVRDISVPGVKILEAEDGVVATVHPPKIVEVVAAAPEEDKGKKGKKK